MLVCDGLDTVSSVWINGVKVGESENMFQRYMFVVDTNLLRVGTQNTITVAFVSPELYANK
mgnify:FL=1